MRFRPLDTWEAEGFRFVDYRNSTAAEIQGAKEILWSVLQTDILDALRPGTQLCQAFGEIDQGCDPSLPVINFCVYEIRSGDLVGAFTWYNIEQAGESPNFSAWPMPAWRPESSWGDVLSWALENDVQPQRTGRDWFRLRAWKYQEQDGHAWVDDPIAVAAIVKQENRGHRVRRRANGRPFEVHGNRGGPP